LRGRPAQIVEQIGERTLKGEMVLVVGPLKKEDRPKAGDKTAKKRSNKPSNKTRRRTDRGTSGGTEDS
jgi:16S rRNA C1402 (ribose-2'-O) methylase RsmI